MNKAKIEHFFHKSTFIPVFPISVTGNSILHTAVSKLPLASNIIVPSALFHPQDLFLSSLYYDFYCFSLSPLTKKALGGQRPALSV